LTTGNPTGTDIAGADLTLNAGPGTGTGTGGDILLRTTTATTTGTTVQTLATRLIISPTQSSFTNTKLLATSHDTIATAEPVPIVLATVGSIDGTSTGETLIYTVPVGERCIVTGAVVRLTAVTGFTSVPDAGIGTTGGADDIFASSALTGLDTAQEFFGFSLGGLSNSIAGGVEIDFGIDVAASATTYTLEVQIIGYLL
jgi:hypothetical protein